MNENDLMWEFEFKMRLIFDEGLFLLTCNKKQYSWDCQPDDIRLMHVCLHTSPSVQSLFNTSFAIEPKSSMIFLSVVIWSYPSAIRRLVSVVSCSNIAFSTSILMSLYIDVTWFGIFGVDNEVVAPMVALVGSSFFL